MDGNYAILVNTTDGFEACWKPFFKLFSYYWPDYKGKIYLNTETRTYKHKGLNIIPIKNGREQDPYEWSNCLGDALSFIEEDYILYFQEDYFIRDYVRCDLIDYFASLMEKDNITYINLYPFSRYGFIKDIYNDHLWKLEKGGKNSFNLQVSLWDRKVLRRIISSVSNKTPWRTEKYIATQRLDNCPGQFLCLNPKRYSLDNMPVSYIIGVVRGKWSEKRLKRLFQKHGMVL